MRSIFGTAVSPVPAFPLEPDGPPYAHRLGETWGPAFTIREELPLFLRRPGSSVLGPFREMTVLSGGPGCFRCALTGTPGGLRAGCFSKLSRKAVPLEEMTGLTWPPPRRELVVLPLLSSPLAFLGRVWR